MSLRITRSDWSLGDLEHYAAWHDREAGWGIAERYLHAVAASLKRLSEEPTMGHPARFDAPELADLLCAAVEKPFNKHLIFYRFDRTHLFAERAVHGARDLPRRLQEPPDR
jgi:plasmid stabilization system protein ParE